jgi:hypothetical protein
VPLIHSLSLVRRYTQELTVSPVVLTRKSQSLSDSDLSVTDSSQVSLLPFRAIQCSTQTHCPLAEVTNHICHISCSSDDYSLSERCLTTGTMDMSSLATVRDLFRGERTPTTPGQRILGTRGILRFPAWLGYETKRFSPRGIVDGSGSQARTSVATLLIFTNLYPFYLSPITSSDRNEVE